MLKSQDIVVLCKLLSYELNKDLKFGYKTLSNELFLSIGECHNSIKRLLRSSLISKDFKGQYRPLKNNVLEILLYGVKYFFPAEIHSIDRGMGTSLSAIPFQKIFRSDTEFVWADYKGKIKGQVIEPLSKNCVNACRKDEVLYRYLSLIDMLRIGQARERKFAKEYLQKELS